MIVGEAWGRKEAEKGKPFVGPSGALLRSYLTVHGIDIRDCYLTNVFNLYPQSGKIESLCGPKASAIFAMPAIKSGKWIDRKYTHELERLYREIRTVKPTIILALGNIACWALLRKPGIKKIRGAPLIGVDGIKVLPSYHPAYILRDMKQRPVLFSDIRKLAREMHFPEVRRPERQFLIPETVEEIASFDKHIATASELSIDIETWQGQITCIGFATSPALCMVIPFVNRKGDGNYWQSEQDEVRAWQWVRKWCESSIPKVGQNFLYDIRYLYVVMGIEMRGEIRDTMLKHHAMQPEMEKSLGFLGSLYTNEPSWKFMRKGIATLKGEDE